MQILTTLWVGGREIQGTTQMNREIAPYLSEWQKAVFGGVGVEAIRSISPTSEILTETVLRVQWFLNQDSRSAGFLRRRSECPVSVFDNRTLVLYNHPCTMQQERYDDSILYRVLPRIGSRICARAF